MILVAGARPNFMKVAPVLWEAERRGIDVTLVHSGQHYDHGMSDVFFEDLGIRSPDVNLNVGSGTQAEQTAKVMVAFESLVAERSPDVVVVVGDVNSTVACGLVAAKAGVHLAHVEAGLRSRDWSMPEEVNRVVTDRLSSSLLAPSSDAVTNLRDEGYRSDQIFLVGNVMVDTLLRNVERSKERSTLADIGVTPQQYALATLHRPANVDDPSVFAGLVTAINHLASKMPVVFPLHPRTRSIAESSQFSDNVIFIDPAGYLDFIALQAGARLVLTDSGGVQEETTMLGVPCLTARENTERPITVFEGSNRVVGVDPTVIVAAIDETLEADRTYPTPPLWDGRAAERIIDVLLDPGFADRPEPTATVDTTSVAAPEKR